MSYAGNLARIAEELQRARRNLDEARTQETLARMAYDRSHDVTLAAKQAYSEAEAAMIEAALSPNPLHYGHEKWGSGAGQEGGRHE